MGSMEDSLDPPPKTLRMMTPRGDQGSWRTLATNCGYCQAIAAV